MLLIPFLKKPDWHHPPWITILLIVINVVVFAGFQAGDQRKHREAYEFYRQASLPRLELPRYAELLGETGRDAEARRIAAAAQDPRLQWFANQVMEHDAAFMRELRADRILRPDHPQHATWKRERQRLDALRAALFTERYLFRADRPDPITFLSANFLHINWVHLLGNMLLLACTGFVVEEVLGRKRYLAFYLLTGIGATLAYWAAHFGSSAGGLGASGAVSGVMGMYAVLFGGKRINFFVWVLFYFDVRRIPAVVLLPIWIANEVLQALYVQAPIAYAAHIGGFLAGGLLAGLFRWQHARAIDDFHDRVQAPAKARERRAQLLREAREHSLRLDFDRALAIYEAMLRDAPQDRDLLGLAYRAARHHPRSEAYHLAAARLLDLEGEDAPTAGLVHETYLEYFQLAKPVVRLTLAQWLKLARRFCDDGFPADAERIVGALLKKPEPPPQLPELVLRLAQAHARAGKPARCRHWLDQLQRRYGTSEAAVMAEQLLRSGMLAPAEKPL